MLDCPLTTDGLPIIDMRPITSTVVKEELNLAILDVSPKSVHLALKSSMQAELVVGV